MSLTSSSSEQEETNDSPQMFDLWENHQGLALKRTSSRASGNHGSKSNSSPSDQLAMNYLATPVTSLKQDPIETWEVTKSVYPLIYMEVQKIFCIVATSVPSERLFLKAGATLSKERNR